MGNLNHVAKLLDALILFNVDTALYFLINHNIPFWLIEYMYND
jgi:hypothetical protein